MFMKSVRFADLCDLVLLVANLLAVIQVLRLLILTPALQGGCRESRHAWHSGVNNTAICRIVPGVSRLLPNWVTLTRNGTNGNVGLFQIRFSTFWLSEPKCTESDLKKSHSCLISGSI